MRSRKGWIVSGLIVAGSVGIGSAAGAVLSTPMVSLAEEAQAPASDVVRETTGTTVPTQAETPDTTPEGATADDDATDDETDGEAGAQDADGKDCERAEGQGGPGRGPRGPGGGPGGPGGRQQPEQGSREGQPAPGSTDSSNV